MRILEKVINRVKTTQNSIILIRYIMLAIILVLLIFDLFFGIYNFTNLQPTIYFLIGITFRIG